jgi:hypothetical protein
MSKYIPLCDAGNYLLEFDDSGTLVGIVDPAGNAASFSDAAATVPADPLTGTETLSIEQDGQRVSATTQEIADLAAAPAAVPIDITLGGGYAAPHFIAQSGDVYIDGVATPVDNIAWNFALNFTSYADQTPGSDLTSVLIENMQASYGDLDIIGFPNLLTISIPDLIYADEPDFNGNSLLTSVSLPALVSSKYLNLGGNPLLETVTLTLLERVRSQLTIGAGALLTANLPALVSLGSDCTFTGAALIGVTLPALVICGGNFSITGDAIATVTLTSLKAVGGDFTVASTTPLAEALTDDLLALLVSLDGTNGTILYENHTVDLAGIPSAAGLLDKATLEGRGCTVNVQA